MRAVIFLPDRNNYDVVTGFTYALARALERHGCPCPLISLKAASLEEVENRIIEASPDFSICFNGLLPHPKIGFLADRMQLPHLAYLIDPPFIFLPLASSPYTHISCVDEDHLKAFDAIACERTLFLPHAWELEEKKEEERIYPYSFLGSAVDPDTVKKDWPHRYGEKLAKLLEYLSLKLLSSRDLSSLDLLSDCFSSDIGALIREGVAGFSLVELWREIELFARGKDRTDLIKSFEGKELHVFGDAYQKGQTTWQAQKGCTVHPPLTFEDAKRVIAKSDVLLNSSPFYKRGGHERILAGLANGCRVFTSDSVFVQQEFAGKVLPYQPLNKEPALKSLETFRAEPLALESHSWDARAKRICSYFAKQLSRL